MKILLLICAALLFVGLIDLPIGYYTLLRIIVTIGSIAVVAAEIKNGINFWVVIFGLIAVLFNPLIPVYLQNKSIWMPLDIISGVIFILKSFNLKQD